MMTIDETIKHCEEKGRGCTKCAAEHRQLSNWLKELKNFKRKRTQNRWKPSEGQVVALNCAITAVSDNLVCLNVKDLESLYQDLKKLMEE